MGQLVNVTTADIDSMFEHGLLTIVGEETLTITTLNTYQKIAGTYVDTSVLNNNFSINTDGILTYNGDGGIFLLNGTTVVSSSQACTIYYGFFINGVLYKVGSKKAETKHTFAVNSKSETLAITGFPTLQTGDTVEIFMKSDNTGDSFTITSLNVTLAKA